LTLSNGLLVLVTIFGYHSSPKQMPFVSAACCCQSVSASLQGPKALKRLRKSVSVLSTI